MISADWSWWTYFLIDGSCVSHGRIQSYDVASRSLTYLRWNGNDPKKNPYSLGTPEFAAWCWDTVEGTYDEIWVDPTKSVTLSRANYDMIKNGERPPTFVRLDESTDPKTYFDGSTKFVSGNMALANMFGKHDDG